MNRTGGIDGVEHDFETLSRMLYTAVLSDTLDAMGLPNQSLRPFVRPLDETSSMMGRARTGRFAPVTEAVPGENPYTVEIALIDDLRPGDIPVLACGGPTEKIVPWGELLTTATRARGGVGCLTDGLVRDVRHIRSLGFPVFHGGIGPLDSRGRGIMVERDTEVDCAGVQVRSGDIIFGDVDGVVVIPAAIASAVIRKALEKVEGENLTRADLERGDLLADVFRRRGIL